MKMILAPLAAALALGVVPTPAQAATYAYSVDATDYRWDEIGGRWWETGLTLNGVFDADMVPGGSAGTKYQITSVGVGAMTFYGWNGTAGLSTPVVGLRTDFGSTFTLDGTGAVTTAFFWLLYADQPGNAVVSYHVGNDYAGVNFASDGDSPPINSLSIRPLGTLAAPTSSGAVPEPAAWTMMTAGIGLAGAASRRRRMLVPSPR